MEYRGYTIQEEDSGSACLIKAGFFLKECDSVSAAKRLVDMLLEGAQRAEDHKQR